MSRRMKIRQPFDLALSLETGQSFSWRRVGNERVGQRAWGDPPARWRANGGGWYSGVPAEYLVHLRRVDGGLKYRVGGKDGELHGLDLDRLLRNYFRLDDDIEEVCASLSQRLELARAIGRYPGLRLLRQDPWDYLVSYLCSGTNTIRGIQQGVEKIARLSRRREGQRKRAHTLEPDDRRRTGRTGTRRIVKQPQDGSRANPGPRFQRATGSGRARAAPGSSRERRGSRAFRMASTCGVALETGAASQPNKPSSTTSFGSGTSPAEIPTSGGTSSSRGGTPKPSCVHSPAPGAPAAIWLPQWMTCAGSSGMERTRATSIPTATGCEHLEEAASDPPWNHSE